VISESRFGLVVLFGACQRRHHDPGSMLGWRWVRPFRRSACRARATSGAGCRLVEEGDRRCGSDQSEQRSNAPDQLSFSGSRPRDPTHETGDAAGRRV
jgi:hypothetical protein